MWYFTTFSSCVFSSIWTIHWVTNGLTSRFHFKAFAPSHLLEHAFQRDVWSPLCLNIIMFWPKGGCLAYNSTNLSSLSIIFPSFFRTFHTLLGQPYPSIVGIFWCVCIHPIDLMGIHLLHCVHANEHIKTHDVICDTFVAIAWDVDFHVGWKQLHVFPSITFNYSHQWVDIVFTKDGIRTLADFDIANPMWVDLLPWSCATQRFTAFD
jgi:hypothetical protein